LCLKSVFYKATVVLWDLLAVPEYKRNFEVKLFFFIFFLRGGTVAQRLNLTYNYWYRTIIGVPEGRFMVAHHGTDDSIAE
jgi:hypothetical protein